MHNILVTVLLQKKHQVRLSCVKSLLDVSAALTPWHYRTVDEASAGCHCHVAAGFEVSTSHWSFLLLVISFASTYIQI